MGGSKKPPKQTDDERHAADQQAQIQQDQIDSANAQARATANIKLPKVLPTPPPPSQTASDVQAAAEDARKKAAKRINGGKGTLFAGETGSYAGALGGAKTLLG